MSTTRVPPDARVHHHEPRMIGANVADDRSISPERMGPHCGEHLVRILGWNDCEQFAFVRDIERIEAKNLAGSLHFFIDWNSRLVE